VVAKPSSGIIIPEAWARSIAFIKFRSGSRDFPVRQTKDDCKFAIAVETADAPASQTSKRKE
jgi:hypothetical protein